MSQVRISASLPQNLVEHLKSWAKQSRTSQSAVLQKALESWLEEQLLSEAEQLASMNFDDVPTESEWERLQMEIKA